MYNGCSYLLDLTAIFFFLHTLRNFYWIPLIFIFIEETNQFRMFYNKTSIFRSSPSQKFFEMGVFKNFAIFTGKHLCWSLFNNVAELSPGILLEKFVNTLTKLQDFCNQLYRFMHQATPTHTRPHKPRPGHTNPNQLIPGYINPQ